MGLLSTPGQPQRYGLLSPGAMGAINSAATMPAPQAPAAPRRGRVNGLRVALDALLGNGDPFESLDKERARLEAEAMRPQMQARQAQLRGLAEAMGPAAMIAFETNPEKFGESLAEQYAPQVIAAGGIQSVIGDGRRVGAPQSREFGDRIATTDPLTGQISYSEPRPATFAEQTGRINANNPINLAPGGRAIDPRSGATIAEGAPRVFSAADATQLFREDGGLLAENTRDAPPVDVNRAAQTAAARTEMADNLQTGLNGSRQFVEAAGVWTHLMPWQRQARANLEGHLETIKGNISFEKLMEMKANSPNGASGLGALSDREARMLANTVGALDADMSPEQLEQSFATIDRLVAKMRQEQAGATSGSASGPIAQDAQGNRVQWNGSAWVPMR